MNPCPSVIKPVEGVRLFYCAYSTAYPKRGPRNITHSVLGGLLFPKIHESKSKNSLWHRNLLSYSAGQHCDYYNAHRYSTVLARAPFLYPSNFCPQDLQIRAQNQTTNPKSNSEPLTQEDAFPNQPQALQAPQPLQNCPNPYSR